MTATATRKPPADAGLRALPALLQNGEGWADLRAALAAGKSGTVDGAWGSSAALATAALVLDAPATVLVVIPNAADVGPWVEDITTFLGARPAEFDAWEAWPVTSNKGKLDPTTTSRLRLLQELQKASAPRVVVCCAAAVCQPVPERADLAARGRGLAVGEIVELGDLAEWLVQNGYKRVEAVEYPGEFSRR
ncbi:MAG: transcription-repair coupling factor, partial [Gemmataceae bacterium]|nr:transcription-repair coupling factor [Gemmataceae bacterium]